jgi:uncharacterized membrane protein
MATEEKQCCGTENKCCDPKKALATLFKIVLGLVFLVLGGWAILKFWGDLLAIIRGGIGLFLILAGVITLAIAKE